MPRIICLPSPARFRATTAAYLKSKPNNQMEFPLYNQEAEKVGTIELADGIFGLAMNQDLLYQVITSQLANKRQVVAHAKGRGEVRGGGKKPWRQKGTGRARHGSIRSPIWVGGGVAHGPRNDKVFARSIPQKMRNKALAMALSKKLADGEVIFVESLDLSSPKTALA